MTLADKIMGRLVGHICGHKSSCVAEKMLLKLLKRPKHKYGVLETVRSVQTSFSLERNEGFEDANR